MRSIVVCFVMLAAAACGPSRGRPGGGGGDGGSGSNSCSATSMCSADLHSVLDCNGNVVTTCPADQGCSAGACVPACQSAADNKSSIGCDYYSVDPDMIDEVAGACFAAYIANTWGSPVTISVERGGQTLPVDQFARVPQGQGQGLTYTPLTNGMLQPGQVAILFLAQSMNTPCPSGITPAVTGTPAYVRGTATGAAFHIQTSAPTVAYDIFPYGGGESAATSATLLLPTSAWDVNYVGVDAYQQSQIAAFAGAQPFIDLVGMTDGTNVTVRPTVAIMGGTGVAAGAQGQNTTYTLSKGEVLQFEQPSELIGSPITADQPIGV